jgi:hypothetical protein
MAVQYGCSSYNLGLLLFECCYYVVVRISLTNNIYGSVPVGMCAIPSPYKYDATPEVHKSLVLGHPVD